MISNALAVAIHCDRVKSGVHWHSSQGYWYTYTGAVAKAIGIHWRSSQGYWYTLAQ